MQGKLKIGLLVDSEIVSKHIYDLAEWANTTNSLQVTHLVIQQRSLTTLRAGLLTRLLRKSPAEHARTALWKLKDRLESRRVARMGIYKGHQHSLDARKVVPGEIRVSPLVSRSGFVHRFSDADVDKVRAEGFDVLLRCGSGILKGSILSSARLGILSFHHGDNRINRGGPAGFWETYHREDRTGFVLQRLTEELDGGDVILRSYIPTQDSHLLNVAMLYAKSYYAVRNLLLQVATSGELPTAESHYPYSGPLLVAPQLHQVASYLLRRTARSMGARVRRTLQMQERWGVYFAKADWRKAIMWRGIRIPTPGGHFLADPFIATRAGRSCLFAEDYVFSTRKGHISAYDINEHGARELGVAIDEDFHLSFPFLFEFAGKLFMCPEACAARQIRIYECIEFPLRWELKVVAMTDVAAADTMIFPKDGLWWMLTNISRNEPLDCGSELHVFWASTPLSGSWTEHPRNPVLSDPLCARNGGLLRDDGELIRVAQGRRFGCYGASARLFRITRLSQEDYAEEWVSSITPQFAGGIHGTHHFHSNGTYSAWDFKQWERV